MIATSYPAVADDATLIGGGQVSGENNSYALLGVLQPLPGSSYGNGWIAKAIADSYTYRYVTNNQKIDAFVFGGAVTMGYQVSDSKGMLGLDLGPSYHDTRLSPTDLSNDTRGGETSARIQVEGERSLTNLIKVNGIASYDAFGTDAYWTRARLLYNLGGTLYTGPQFIYQGDKNYDAWSVGATLLGIQVTKTSSVGFNLGVTKSENVNASPYAGLEFGAAF